MEPTHDVPRLARSPPVVGSALAAGAGATLLHLGVPLPWTLLLLPAFLLPNRSFNRPGIPRGALALSLLAGYLLTLAWREARPADCRFLLRDGQVIRVEGRLAGPLVEGRGEILPRRRYHGGCAEVLRLVVPGQVGSEWTAGSLQSVSGRWRKSQGPGSIPPIRAGYLRVDSVGLPSGSVRPGLKELRVMAGGWVQGRIHELFPETGPVVAALVWARKEGLRQDVREAFARAGTAHLLAISGFHVGVVAGLLFLLLGLAGVPHAARFLLSSLAVWIYVLAIGVPPAAGRAALLISLLALGRGGQRAVAPLGALATAFLGFLLVDPGALLGPGFQLSFAGAFGLVTGSRTLSRWISAKGRGRLPHSLCQGLAAGVSATLATLPLVGWHFGRISLIGIPLTLLVTPLIVLAIPGIFTSLLLALVHPGSARFLASGVEPVLQLLLEAVARAASLPFASVWVSQATVLAGSGALGAAGLLVLLRPPTGGGSGHRLLVWSVVAGVLVGPPLVRLRDSGVMELVVLDVGQGDAALLRSPGGRWVLVDAGPRTESFDAGARTVLPYLRRRGVRELELLILTHPDMDHVGGAASVLAEFPVGAVMDPGVPAGTDAFLAVLEGAGSRAVPWRVVSAGDSLDLDGMALRVLAPEDPEEASSEEGRNGASLVLEVRWGSFAALLTGDAPTSSEARFLQRLLSPRVQVLKVGHHGSATSTSSELMERADPEAALISVGRGNRFGHPASEVLARLAGGGARVLRTDQGGTLVVRARRDGGYTLSARYD